MDYITCPICQTKTSFNLIVIEDKRAYLPEPSTDTHPVYGPARVLAIYEAKYPHKVSFAILECGGCGERFVAKKHEYDDRDWVPVYPISCKKLPELVSQPIKEEFEEASLCFAVGAYRACASMCQRTLESLCQHKQVSGLNQLKEDGIISSKLFDRATEIRLWAGLTKHRPLTESVLKEDAEQLLTYLEMILEHVYVEQARFDALKEKREKIDKGKNKE